MDSEQIKVKRKELEKTIFTLLDAFEEETGTNINNICIKSDIILSMDDHRLKKEYKHRIEITAVL